MRFVSRAAFVKGSLNLGGLAWAAQPLLQSLFLGSGLEKRGGKMTAVAVMKLRGALSNLQTVTN